MNTRTRNDVQLPPNIDSDAQPHLSRRSVCRALGMAAALPLFTAYLPGEETAVTLSLQAALPRPVPADYAGFSYETMQLADPSFFAPDNYELIALFRNLSASGVLRIGGNSSEFCWWKTHADQSPPPIPASARNGQNWMPHTLTAIEPVAIDRLQAFLGATGWKAIYGLNLGTGTPERAAEEAAYVARVLGSRLLYFQIGNEPEFYRDANNGLRSPDWDFEKYLAQWTSFAKAVLAAVPDAQFGGPDVGSNASWVVRFAEQAPKIFPGHIAACTGHYYAEGPPDSPRVTVARLLATDPRIDRDMTMIMQAANQTGIGFRMTEGNSCYRGGKPGMSNAFCSALWAADYMLHLASYGCVGVNLHGGGAKQIRASLGGHLPGETLDPAAEAVAREGSFYTPIAGSRETGFHARPVFYGMKLANLLSGGRMRTAVLNGTPEGIVAYAADMDDGSTRVILINKSASADLQIRIAAKEPLKFWRLEASSLTATSGVTLAAASITAAAAWKPLREEKLDSRNGFVSLQLKAASAVALFSKKRLG
jgi:hypothetical protein